MSATMVGARQKEGRSGRDVGNIQWKLSQFNTKAQPMLMTMTVYFTILINTQNY
jgi:hypothetical protein